MRWYTKIVRKLTAWAWGDEIHTSEGLTRIKELHAKPGSIELELENRPELQAWIGKAFAAMVLESPNYTELRFEIAPPYQKNGETTYHWITVLVKKGSGKTPHQLRRKLRNVVVFWSKRLWIWSENWYNQP
jgi:hypothetical protein